MTDGWGGDPMARAGDYVLGLMDEAERERAERDLETDAAFRDCVAALAVRMHSLDRTAGEEAVPDGMWQTIEERIAALPQMTGALPQRGVPEPQAPPAGISPFPLSRKPIWRAPQAFSGFRGTLVAACLIAALGVGYLAGMSSVTANQPIVVVVLADEENVPGAIVEAYENDAVRIVPLVDFAVPEGKILEVWTLYDETVGPVSIGTMPEATEVRLQGPIQPSPQPEQLYEITLEDAPGSPVGRPTGPILVKGLAVRPAGN